MDMLFALAAVENGVLPPTSELLLDPGGRAAARRLYLDARIFPQDFHPAEAEQRNWYNAHINVFFRAETRRQLRVITIPVDPADPDAARAEAEAAAAALRAGEITFKDAALAHSQDAFKRRGGDQGFIPATGKPGLDPELVAWAYASPVGELQGPRKIGGNWFLLLVAQERPAGLASFELSQSEVLAYMESEAREAAEQAELARLRAGARIQVDEEALAAFVVPCTLWCVH